MFRLCVSYLAWAGGQGPDVRARTTLLSQLLESIVGSVPPLSMRPHVLTYSQLERGTLYALATRSKRRISMKCAPIPGHNHHIHSSHSRRIIHLHLHIATVRHKPAATSNTHIVPHLQPELPDQQSLSLASGAVYLELASALFPAASFISPCHLHRLQRQLGSIDAQESVWIIRFEAARPCMRLLDLALHYTDLGIPPQVPSHAIREG